MNKNLNHPINHKPPSLPPPTFTDVINGQPERLLRVLCSLTMVDKRNREKEKGKVKERDSLIEWK